MRFAREVRPEPMVDFADLLQDPNPIHLDEAAARGRVINQGPINAGYVIAMLRAAYPDATISSIRLRFMANVRGGDHVTAGGEVVFGGRGRGALRRVARHRRWSSRGRGLRDPEEELRCHLDPSPTCACWSTISISAVEDWTKILSALDPGQLERQIVRYDDFDGGGDAVRWATFVSDHGAEIQLMEPGPDTHLGKRLAKHGEHVHHICFTTDDPAAVSKRLADEGLNTSPEVYEDPDMTWQRWTWVLPDSAHGTLVEIARPYKAVDGGWVDGLVKVGLILPIQRHGHGLDVLFERARGGGPGRRARRLRRRLPDRVPPGPRRRARLAAARARLARRADDEDQAGNARSRRPAARSGAARRGRVDARLGHARAASSSASARRTCRRTSSSTAARASTAARSSTS